MHEKDLDVDGYLLRSGSANWSIGGLRRQDISAGRRQLLSGFMRSSNILRGKSKDFSVERDMPLQFVTAYEYKD
jgi:hypothetical protein